jgi:hypothetical protein
MTLCIDLYCGLGGWAQGFLAEGYTCVGFDISRHDYGTGTYPGQLVLQDVRTLHGSQFKDAAIIVASPPCQEYSYRAMPWKRAKSLPPPSNELFEACFRIQREACEAAGRYIPLIVENVCGAQKWVGRAAWHFGSYYLWGDVPALMPFTRVRKIRSGAPGDRWSDRECQRLDDALKVPSFRFDGSGRSFQTASVRRTNRGNGARFTSRDCGFERNLPVHLQSESQKRPGLKISAGFNNWPKDAEGHYIIPGSDGNKFGGGWWHDSTNNLIRKASSRSTARRAASAQIAKIPFPLAQWIARCYREVAA